MSFDLEISKRLFPEKYALVWEEYDTLVDAFVVAYNKCSPDALAYDEWILETLNEQRYDEDLTLELVFLEGLSCGNREAVAYVLGHGGVVRKLKKPDPANPGRFLYCYYFADGKSTGEAGFPKYLGEIAEDAEDDQGIFIG